MVSPSSCGGYWTQIVLEGQVVAGHRAQSPASLSGAPAMDFLNVLIQVIMAERNHRLHAVLA